MSESLAGLWERLGNTPVDDDGCIQEPFEHFPKGTHREKVWRWTEEAFDVSVHDLMFRAEKEIE